MALAVFSSFLLIQDLHSLLKREVWTTEQWSQNMAVIMSHYHQQLTPLHDDRQSAGLSQLEGELLDLRDSLQIVGRIHLKIVTPTGQPLEVSSSPHQSRPLAPPGWSFTQGRLLLTTSSATTRDSHQYVITLERDAMGLVFQGTTFLLSLLVFVVSLFILLIHRPWKNRNQTLFASLETGRDALMELSADGLMLRLNAVFAEWFGRPIQPLLGQSFIASELKPQVSDLKESLESLLRSRQSFRAHLFVTFGDKRMNVSSAFFWSDAGHWTVALEDRTHEWETQERAQFLGRENLELQRQALTDSLTGCYNRAFLDSLIEPRQLKYLQLDGCTMILMDIDCFKSINDKWGHPEGDRLLRALGMSARNFFRRSDKVIRYGGDEFIVILNSTTLEMAQTVASNFCERARRDLADLLPNVIPTFSIGIAELDMRESGEQWLQRADRALYRSKQEGRNRIIADDLNQLELLN